MWRSRATAQQPHICAHCICTKFEYVYIVLSTPLGCRVLVCTVHLMCAADRAAEGRRSLDQEGLHRFLASEADRLRAPTTSVSASTSTAAGGAAIRGGGGAHYAAQPLARLLQRPLFDYFVRSPLIPRSVAGFILIDSTSTASLI